MTYEVIILGHLHMPLYFIGTFTEYSYLDSSLNSPVFMDRYPEMCRRPGIEIISLYFQGLAATYGYPVGWNSRM